MTMAELKTDLTQYSSDAVTVVPVLAGTTPECCASSDLGIDADRLARLGVTGKAGETLRVLVTAESASEEAPVLLVGAGKERTAEALRRAAGIAARALKSESTVVYDLKEATDVELEALLTGHLLGGYRFDRFRGEADETVSAEPQQLSAVGVGEAVITRVNAIAGAVRITRDLVNTPPSALVPEDFADFALDLFTDSAVEVEVWDEERLVEESCGGILGVGQGSENPPHVVRLNYAPEGATTHVALVGKGITFDSGGLSIKPAGSMVGMKFDMGGAASVLGTVRAVAELGLPIAITGWCMLAENMPSGSAIKPDDVLVTRSGKTVEVTNTDAEGRLVLCDGLTLASEQQPDLIIDIATLTGAAIVALGDRTTGMVGNDQAWVDRAMAASKKSGEDFWPMPIPEEIAERLKSPVADMVNSKPGDRSAGMLFAAAFLERFVGDDESGKALPWLHLDIAGPAETKSAYGYVPEGGSGVPVRTLVSLFEALTKN
ncbi:leucyl aminopeptidase [Gulosibacter bifidus]|uniref:Probable cytosol aminopeptidase n=1 Tax=Gulosibacter bifidus TaxID=272239 RepID=A0ABW5RFT8_9MICO|nr:leucyl aminopeptidase [Gulosibacter bifidus]